MFTLTYGCEMDYYTMQRKLRIFENKIWTVICGPICYDNEKKNGGESIAKICKKKWTWHQ